MANATHNSGKQPTPQRGARGAIKSGSEAGKNPSELDLAGDIKGNNSLQGDDQSNKPNQRQAQADTKAETDDLMESFEKLDKDVRAERDLGKGNRHKAKPH